MERTNKQKVDGMTRAELIAEYKLIIQKKSKLSSNARYIVESRIAKLHKQGKITVEQLKINNQI